MILAHNSFAAGLLYTVKGKMHIIGLCMGFMEKTKEVVHEKQKTLNREVFYKKDNICLWNLHDLETQYSYFCKIHKVFFKNFPDSQSMVIKGDYTNFSVFFSLG